MVNQPLGMRRLYRYSGPVFKFGKCVEGRLLAETYAESPQKALSNIAYQYKINHGYAPHAFVQLSPDCLKEGEKWK